MATKQQELHRCNAARCAGGKGRTAATEPGRAAEAEGAGTAGRAPQHDAVVCGRAGIEIQARGAGRDDLCSQLQGQTGILWPRPETLCTLSISQGHASLLQRSPKAPGQLLREDPQEQRRLAGARCRRVGLACLPARLRHSLTRLPWPAAIVHLMSPAESDGGDLGLQGGRACILARFHRSGAVPWGACPHHPVLTACWGREGLIPCQSTAACTCLKTGQIPRALQGPCMVGASGEIISTPRSGQGAVTWSPSLWLCGNVPRDDPPDVALILSSQLLWLSLCKVLTC